MTKTRYVLEYLNGQIYLGSFAKTRLKQFRLDYGIAASNGATMKERIVSTFKACKTYAEQMRLNGPARLSIYIEPRGTHRNRSRYLAKRSALGVLRGAHKKPKHAHLKLNMPLVRRVIAGDYPPLAYRPQRDRNVAAQVERARRVLYNAGNMAQGNAPEPPFVPYQAQAQGLADFAVQYDPAPAPNNWPWNNPGDEDGL